MALVYLEATGSREFRIAGVDSWQALSLAMRFAEMQIEQLTSDGWRLCLDDEGDTADSQEPP